MAVEHQTTNIKLWRKWTVPSLWTCLGCLILSGFCLPMIPSNHQTCIGYCGKGKKIRSSSYFLNGSWALKTWVIKKGEVTFYFRPLLQFLWENLSFRDFVFKSRMEISTSALRTLFIKKGEVTSYFRPLLQFRDLVFKSRVKISTSALRTLSKKKRSNAPPGLSLSKANWYPHQLWKLCS